VRPWRVVCLFLALAPLAGCVTTRTATSASNGGGCLPSGRNLFLARVSGDENRATAEAAAEMLMNALRDSAHVASVRDLMSEAGLVGLVPWASSVSARLQRGGRLTMDETRTMWERFGINTVVVTEVIEYDQVWGKYAKFTRAGLEAQAFDLPGDRVLWRMRSDTEVEEMRGRAFRVAMESAVQELAEVICPRREFSLVNVWRSWRR
jgi:hypothetical protein